MSSSSKNLLRVSLNDYEVESLSSTIVEKPNSYIKKGIEDEYSQGALGNLMWFAQHAKGRRGGSGEWVKAKERQYQKISELALGLFNILEYNADFCVEVIDSTLLREEPYDFISDDGIDRYKGNMDTSCDKICDTLGQLLAAVKIGEEQLRLTKNKKGRASLRPYYDFIFANAELYEQLSNNKFTILRHVQNSSYCAVTPAHRFCQQATEILNAKMHGDPYTDKNLMNACEKAVGRLRRTNLSR